MHSQKSNQVQQMKETKTSKSVCDCQKGLFLKVTKKWQLPHMQPSQRSMVTQHLALVKAIVLGWIEQTE